MKHPEFKYAIIDLDIPIFKSASIAQKTRYKLWDGDRLEGEFESANAVKTHIWEAQEFRCLDTSDWVRESYQEMQDVDVCYYVLDNLITGYCDAVKARGVFSIDGDGNFRDKIATIKKYKGNRTQERPLYLNDVREYAKRKYKPKVADKIESDDQISLWLYQDYLKAGGDPSRCTAVMIDLEKDCRTTPGWHFHPDKDERPVWISELEANRWLFTQTLAGDPSDNYSGCNGIGMKKATAALEGCQTTPEMVEAVSTLFAEAYGDEYEYKAHTGKIIKCTYKDIMLENLKLAMMLRTRKPKQDLAKLLGEDFLK